MTCDAIREQLTAYHLGDLDAATAAAVRAHLDTCRDCQAALQEIATTLDLLRDALAGTAPSIARLPEERKQRIRSAKALPAAAPRRWIFASHPRLAYAAGITVVVGLLALMLLPAVSRSRKSATMTQTLNNGRGIYQIIAAEDLDKFAVNTDSSIFPQSAPKPAAAPPAVAPATPASASDDMGVPAETMAQLDEIKEVELTDALQELPVPPPPQEPQEPETVSSEFSPQPTVLDSVAMVESPARVSGHYGYRTSAPRGKALAKSGGGSASGGAGSEVEEDQLRDEQPVWYELGQSKRSSEDKNGELGKDQNMLADAKNEEFSSEEDSEFSVASVGAVQTGSFAEGAESQVEDRRGPPAPADNVPEEWSPPSRRVDATQPQGEYAGNKKDAERLNGAYSSQVYNKTGGLFRFRAYLHSTGATQSDEVVAAKTKPEDASGPSFFQAAGFNPYVDTTTAPMSTFGIDVDTASYTLARNLMNKGFLPPPEAVRTEEFINFFDYNYHAPVAKTFAIEAELAPSKFGHGEHLLKIGVKGRRLGREEQRSAALTLLIDTSGSMETPERLGLLQRSLHQLVDKLGEHDLISIVQYDTHARVVLDQVAASDRAHILEVIDSLQCSGSTNLEEGMAKAYAQAVGQFVSGGENRVLVMSDGMANLGSDSADAILKRVADSRKQGIRCSVFGFGTGAYNDALLEALADKGDGVYAFIDSDQEAQRVFVDDLAATLNTIASDVKIQVEFNPDAAPRYRQLGYENRQLTAQQFRDDAVDAGEVGSGQSVTALYELTLGPGADTDLVATIRVRYRRLDNGQVEEIALPVQRNSARAAFEAASTPFRLAAGVAEFAEILRGSPHAAGSEFSGVAEVLRPVALDMGLDGRVQELLHLVEGAGGLSRAP